MNEKEMHWLYLLFGGFILGILSLIFVYSLTLVFKGLGGSDWTILHSMKNLIKRAWGYW